jgi:CRP-like cAMP-binding protein
MARAPSDEGDGRENFILAALPDEEYARLRERLEPVDLDLKQLIYETDQPIRHAYFPTSAVLSMISQVDGEAAVEVATIGREGMAGLPVFLGVGASPNTIFAQIPGLALRMRAEQLRDVLAGDGALHRQLHRYIQATMVQLSQNVACNRLHSPEERAARWLLMTADRVGAERFPLTQEIPRPDARRAPRNRLDHRRAAAQRGSDQLQAWRHHRGRSGRARGCGMRLLRHRPRRVPGTRQASLISRPARATSSVRAKARTRERAANRPVLSQRLAP